MKRRDFVSGLGAGALAGGLAACAREAAGPTVRTSGQTFEWKMVTTWPPNYPGLGTGADYLAHAVERMSGGRIKVRVYAAGELVPAFEVFDAVSGGTAEMGHGAGYYWKDKSEAAQFFTAVPFGMNAQEMNAWLYFGDGLGLWQEVYARFNLVPAPAGNTGVQMGGWFNREIKTLGDLQGLKMRIPGLGGEVLRRAGGTPVVLPGSEIFTALQTGSIDATEWVGPYNDMAFGLHNVAKYYYYPGWHEPGPTLECIFNADALAELPEDLRAIALYACEAANSRMAAEYTALNLQALETLVKEHGVQLRAFPDDVIARLRELSKQVLDELAARDPLVKRVYDSYREFQQKASAWLAISEQAYLAIR